MTTTAIKLIALALMLLDHIYEFFAGAPIWLTWLGRISAPLFLFTMVWGLFYTSDRRKYLVNMYLWGVLMAAGDVVVTVLVPNAHAAPSNNIFVSLLLVGLIVTAAELVIKHRTKEGLLLFAALAAAQLAGELVLGLLNTAGVNSAIRLLVIAALPNIMLCEGSIYFVLGGVLLYFAKESRLKLTVAYLIFTIVFAGSFGLGGLTAEWLLYHNYQWMMIAALPIMLCYNGRRGADLKWLFYILYPAHIYLLCIIGSFFA